MFQQKQSSGMMGFYKSDRHLMKSCYYQFNLPDPQFQTSLPNPSSYNPLLRSIELKKSLQGKNRKKKTAQVHTHNKIYSQFHFHNTTLDERGWRSSKINQTSSSCTKINNVNLIQTLCGGKQQKINNRESVNLGQYKGKRKLKQKNNRIQNYPKWMSKLDRLKMMQKTNYYQLKKEATKQPGNHSFKKLNYEYDQLQNTRSSGNIGKINPQSDRKGDKQKRKKIKDVELNLGIKTLLVFKNKHNRMKSAINLSGRTHQKQKTDPNIIISPTTLKCYHNEKESQISHNHLFVDNKQQHTSNKATGRKKSLHHQNEFQIKVLECVQRQEEENNNIKQPSIQSNISIHNSSGCESLDLQENSNSHQIQMHSSILIGNLPKTQEIKKQQGKKEMRQQGKKKLQSGKQKKKEQGNIIRQFLITSADSFGGWDFKVQNDEEHVSFDPVNLHPIKKRNSKSAGRKNRRNLNEITKKEELQPPQPQIITQSREDHVIVECKEGHKKKSRRCSRRRMLTEDI